MKIKEFIKENRWKIIAIILLILGVLVRLIDLGKVPNALNVDEASSGYDAYALMKYGKDRRGNTFPVYLYAWGSGQSALYSYLTIPVIAITGLTELGIRLPMAIVRNYLANYILLLGSKNI